MRRSRTAKPEKYKELTRRWRAQYPERVAEYKRREYLKHRDAYVERARRWGAENPERYSELHAASERRRRAWKAGGSSESYLLADLLVRDQYRCYLCGDQIDAALAHPDPLSPSVDHIVALANGGSDLRTNVAATHLICNIRKGARPPAILKG